MDALGELAAGNIATQVSGLERHDEIGKVAGAIQIFKEKMIEAERLRAEQLEAEQGQSERRKAEMQKLADGFEAAIGEIVETVSSASTELEASAGSLTATAERTQEVTTMVASASRRGLNQRAVGGLGDRGDGFLRQRDQPPGAGIGADGQ